MPIRRCWKLLIAVAALGALTACRGPKPRDHTLHGKWEQAWDVDQRADVRVVAEDAHVFVKSVPEGREVSIQVVYDLRKVGLVFGASKPDVRFERQGDVMSVTVREPGGVVTIGGVAELLEVYVSLPLASDLSVRTADGAVSCGAVDGKVRIETQDGHVRAHGLHGDVRIASGDGRVEADSLDGRLEVRSSDGSLTLRGRFDALAVHTQDGRSEVTAESGSRVSGPWELESGDGSVLLRIPADLRAFLDVRTRGGSVRADLPIPGAGRQKDHRMQGELNGGGEPLRVRTGDGSVTLALAP